MKYGNWPIYLKKKQNKPIPVINWLKDYKKVFFKRMINSGED